ncbi:hypothetical protein [Halosolutus gelatinilyticus]|uniref:hypothetical protein n=1 Tax=Halosolutus gelatinilyticus TaxID=2931975 RepID=UPI001FF33962|nr:hypothetical protein [Halosolutus gelatinilyticus]
MGDRKFTLIELHLDGDTQFGPGTIGGALPFGGTDAETEETESVEEDEDAAAADEDSGRRSPVGALVALAVLVAIGVAAKKYTSDDEEDLAREEEPDVIVN